MEARVVSDQCICILDRIKVEDGEENTRPHDRGLATVFLDHPYGSGEGHHERKVVVLSVKGRGDFDNGPLSVDVMIDLNRREARFLARALLELADSLDEGGEGEG